MDKHNFPPLEPDNSQPEYLPVFPEKMESLDDQPVIQELFFQEAPVSADVQANWDEPSAEAEESVAESDPEIPDILPAEEDLPLAEALSPQAEISPEPAEEEPALPDMIPEEIPAADPVIAFEIPENDDKEDPQNLAEQEVSSEEQFILEHPDLLKTPEPVPVNEVADQDYRDNGQEFDAMFHAPTPQPEKAKPAERAAASKGRPKRKKGEGLLGIPSILVTFVWLALILIIGVTAGRMLWICAADILAFGREDKVVTVTVYESDSMDEIIEKLHQGGLIRYKSLFSLYADISDAEEDIKPGIYDLNTRYDYHALVNFMSPRSSREVIKVTIPEGYTCRQVFALLEENRVCTAVDAAAYAANGELSDYWFLEGLERGAENCLEGYLFPDTYEFYKNSTPKEAIERMLDNFAYRFDEEMLAQLETLNGTVTDGSYGIREIVIIASLIEKESAAPAESPAVSGVIYNRLFRWGGNPPYLNIDASIVYAQNGSNDRIDTKLDDPYNTYLYEGLTPGPIANPGLSSLKAALNPESHNYYYYVLNPSTGMHQFSTSYEEHTGYVRQFAAATED